MSKDEIPESENESIYAYNSEMEVIFIEDVPSEHRGLRGDYYCLGCKKQMQAVLPKTNRQKYFRHHVSKNHRSECTYFQETHRHFLAKTYLKELNKIKVPSVIKYSETNSDEAYLIKKSQIIEASSIVTEKAIYEDENGEIKLTDKNYIDKNKFLYIIPDAILLDPKGKPKLLVEFVATHKPDQDKLMKLKRLGIDAVQVNVPKSSPESIKESLLVSSRTKWLYNNDEQNADIIQLSNENQRRVHETDDLQRRLFEEGFKCRSAQIGELIRSIERLLESESYRETEQYIRSEIQRVTESSERTKSELGRIREHHIRKGIEEHQERRTDLEIQSQKLRYRREHLEERYYSKRQRVEDKIRDIEEETERIEETIERTKNEPSIEQLIKREQEKGRSLESRSQELSGEKERLPKSFERDKEEIRRDFIREEKQLKEASHRIQREIIGLQEKGKSLSKSFENDKREEQRRFEEARERNTKRRVQLESRRNSLNENYRRKEEEALREIRERHGRAKGEILDSTEKLQTKYSERDFTGTTGDRFFENRIPDLIKHSRDYSTYLFIYRSIKETNSS